MRKLIEEVLLGPCQNSKVDNDNSIDVLTKGSLDY